MPSGRCVAALRKGGNIKIFASAVILLAAFRSGSAGEWIGPTGAGEGGSWATDANWDPAAKPNATGATASFTANSGSARTVTVDSGSSGFTVGSITYNAAPSTTQATSITTGSSGSKLLVDNGGAGATLSSMGVGTGNLTISAQMMLNDNLTISSSQTSATSSAGALNLTGAITGTGGVTINNGSAKMTYGTNAKSYGGPTTFNSGYMRLSVSGRPSGTSSFTINNGATLEFLENLSGSTTFNTFTLGIGNLELNGSGLNAQGLIRPQRIAGGRRNVITNNVVLQGDSVVHVQSLDNGSNNTGIDDLTHILEFQGAISGGGALIQTAIASNQELGRVVLDGANIYTGGTIVRGGRMEVSGNVATFGQGDVSVLNPATILSPGPGADVAISRLVIPDGVSNAIADGKALSVAGASRAFVQLGAQVNEVVGSLSIAGTPQLPGRTYGSMSSNAMVKDDTAFAGAGIITVGLLGDFNGNHAVDAADYVIWRKSYSSDTSLYALWRSHLGNTSPGSGLTTGGSVPEPGTLAILLIGTQLCFMGRRSNRAVCF